MKSEKWFYISSNVWNNSFAFKAWKKIWVADIDFWSPDDIGLWNKIVFADIDNWVYKESVWLSTHLWILKDEKYNLPCPVFVCDNHNRVLKAWQHFKNQKPFLIHIDQHRDEACPWNVNDFDKDLRVCDYIDWAKSNLWIQEGHLSLCESRDFLKFENEKELLLNTHKKNIILNIDLDIFAPEQTLVPHEIIWEIIFSLSKRSCLVTIASSPIFLNQDLALKLFRKFFKFFLKK